MTNTTTWAATIAKRWDFEEKHATEVSNRVRVAYERLKAGGTDDDFDLVAGSLNVAIVRAEMIGAGPLVEAIQAKRTTRATPMGDVLALAFRIHASMDKARGLMAIIASGMDALVAADARHEQHGSYGFDGAGLAAMNEAIDAYVQIMSASNGVQMEAASAEVHRRSKVAA